MNIEFTRAQVANVDGVEAILEGTGQWLLLKGIKQWIYPCNGQDYE